MPTETERIGAKWVQYLADIYAYKGGKYAAKRPKRRKPAATSCETPERDISGVHPGREEHVGEPVRRRVARTSTRC